MLNIKNVSFRRIFFIPIIIIFFIISDINGYLAATNNIPAKKCNSDKFMLKNIQFKNVDANICIPSFSEREFSMFDFDDYQQIAVLENPSPFIQLSLREIPFGYTPPNELLPVAGGESEDQYRNDLFKKRNIDDKNLEKGPRIKFFGKEIESSITLSQQQNNSTKIKPTLIIEWLTNFNNSTWILRASIEVNSDQNLIERKNNDYIRLFKDLQVNGNIRKTIPTYQLKTEPTSNLITEKLKYTMASACVTTDPSNPCWWNGFCDVNNHPGSFALSANGVVSQYRGVIACGPGTGMSGYNGYNTVVNYGVGASELEWQCVEFSMRYMYLIHSIRPYILGIMDPVTKVRIGAAKRIVQDYPGGKLIPQSYDSYYHALPSPGDVLAIDNSPVYGHTAVVSEVNINPTTGKGSITVIEQNALATGRRTINTDYPWHILQTTAWLHDPSSDQPSLSVNLSSTNVGTGNVNWSAGPHSNAQVYYSVNNGPDQLFATGNSGSKMFNNFESNSFYNFYLYEGTAHQNLLSQYIGVKVKLDFNRDGKLDLMALSKYLTASGRTDAYIASGAPSGNEFQSLLVGQPTLASTTDTNWSFAMADWDKDGIKDLFLIGKNGTQSGKTEVHILSGATKFQTYLDHIITALGTFGTNVSFSVGDWDKDGKPDLIMIAQNGTGSNKVEAFILSGSTGYKSYLDTIVTGMGVVGTNTTFTLSDVDRDSSLDLVAVARNNTQSCRTEIFALSSASRLQNYALGLQTGFGVFGNNVKFFMGDWDQDGSSDLIMVASNGTSSGKVEIFAVDGSTNYQSMILNRPTLFGAVGANTDFLLVN